MQGWQSTPVGLVPRVSPKWGLYDRLGAALVRLGPARDNYRISPGLYALGSPDQDSPVLVTCNFKLTFDILRKQLSGRSLWLLVVETYGINVWCAAGKHSFSTEEVAQRVRQTGLDRVVSHRTLILPQLAGPAVAAHRLKKLCGFSGFFGPVRIKDLPAYLDSGMRAGQEMRKVRFPLGQRLTVALVEVHGARKFLLWTLAACLILAILGPGGFTPAGVLGAGLGAFATVLTGFVTGVFLVPALLPSIPLRAYSAKGLLAGAVTGFLPAGILAGTLPQALAQVLACSAFASWFAMFYTGSTPFTSLSGVDREMRFYMPIQGSLLLLAVMVWLLPPWL
ncbi:MAG: carbon monoxide dehydrogenase [Desulfohalobiaceae bacterium]|nr:carbon monoxide dehydrogenase [Desulfohalobiaceae bacterium]